LGWGNWILTVEYDSIRLLERVGENIIEIG